MDRSCSYRMLLSVVFSLSKVALWYQGWKDRFPENLRSDPRVMAQFSAALTLMEQVNCVRVCSYLFSGPP